MTITNNNHERINHGAAEMNRERFARHAIFVASLFGGPGCGKTSLIEATLRKLQGELRIGVVIGNILADQDAERLRNLSHDIIAIEAVDLSASLVYEALDRIDLSHLDALLIERAGATIAANRGSEDLGQDANVGIFSVSGGDDKVARYPERVQHSDLLLLTKIDLLPHAPFDLREFRKAIHSLNPLVPLTEISVLTGQGMEHWCAWLRGKTQRCAEARGSSGKEMLDYFCG
jgi:hydrogenase nickel incorporation protein HypB